ncbi:receptor-type tyrosine-protein phosphatase alpha-like [Saccostrea cucullata]|uniref:receptor-type tyrosine-protein phosphatase alpha-like n=1 Tax=Saccostrea cuccullata TaxID=36930 RepID=UPI002ED48753
MYFSKEVAVKEIEVFGGMNIALWKAAEQSTNLNEAYTSDKAVDGLGNGDDMNTCSHTSEISTPPTWNVSLANNFSVTSMYIVNRKDFQTRINKFTVYGKQGETIKNIYNDTSSDSRDVIWIDGRYWKPELLSEIIVDGKNLKDGLTDNKILTLCEVFILACRPLENGNDDCRSFCPKKCQQSELCLNENFTCPKCIPGWKGDYCQNEVTCNQTLLMKNALSYKPRKPRYSFNETIHYSCADGYLLRGSTYAVCAQDSSFQFHEGESICEEVTCNQTLLMKNALSYNPRKPQYSFNETIHYSCADGYILRGSTNAVCAQDSSFQYHEGEPFCEELTAEMKSRMSVIVGTTVGTVLVFILVVIILVSIRRYKKKPSIYRDIDECRSMDNLDHQYAQVHRTTIKQENTKTTANVSEKMPYYNFSSGEDKTETSQQNTYYDFTSKLKSSSTAVKVSDFKDFVDNKRRDKEYFDEQFQKLYSGLQFPATVAVTSENRPKNKYKNIYPYDETRVKLEGSGRADYINASYIHGYVTVRSYIAAHGPLVNTIDDFWMMVWNERSGKIVMLTNLIEDDKVKCIQYWPEEEKIIAGNLTIEMVDMENFSDLTIRTFCLKNGTEKRLVRHLHFTAWPDKGVPLYASSLVHFHSKVKITTSQGKGPIIVHCSAGIGRTGTFIALDYLIQQAKESEYVDVFGCVEILRRQRVNTVQTLEQYIFVHNALLEALMCTSSDPSANEFPLLYIDFVKIDSKSGKRNIDLHFENMMLGIEEIPSSAYRFAKEKENHMKNRNNNILPVDSEMPELRDEEFKRVYINAVFLPAYRMKRSFIVTQMPLKETVDDFWRLVSCHNVSTIVMLNQTAPSDDKQNIGIYWPESSNSRQFNQVNVYQEGLSKREKDYTTIDLQYKIKDEEEIERRIRIFKCNFWPDSATIPSSVLSFLKLVNAVELHHDRNNTGPVVVHCLDGSEKSGLFCVLQVVLERLKIEQDVAIHQVIQQMRSVRPSIIPNVMQFEFCHDVVMEFLKQYDAYSNFQGQ